MTTQEKQTTIINLWCGPGAGKSTTAADVFATMKKAGVSCELRTEWVKDMAWRGTPIGPFDDVVITANQLYAESAVYGKVDYIVTDSPIGLGAVYEQAYPGRNHGVGVMWNLCSSLRARQLAAGLRLVDCLIDRRKPYVHTGRYEDETAARRIDGICREHLTVLCGQGGYHVVVDASDVLRAAGVVLP